MWHATCTKGNWGDSQLLVVRSQIANLIHGLYFGHNLCFKYPNGSCKPILDIYAPKHFQWYKELFNPMSFDLCDCFMKISESIGIPIPKVGTHLGVWKFIPSHFPTLSRAWNATPRLHSWLAPLQTLTLVASPRLGLRHFALHGQRDVFKQFMFIIFHIKWTP
jgi:hypothetical protein